MKVPPQPELEQSAVAVDTSGDDLCNAAKDGDCARMLTLLDAGAEADEMVIELVEARARAATCSRRLH